MMFLDPMIISKGILCSGNFPLANSMHDF